MFVSSALIYVSCAMRFPLFSLIITCSLLVFLPGKHAFGQEKKEKSSFSKVPATQDYLENADANFEKNPKYALSNIEKALEKAIREKDVQSEAKAYQLLGKLNLSQGLYKQAVLDFRKAVEKYTLLKNSPEIWETNKLLAQALEKNGDLAEAEKIYAQLLEQAERKKDTDKIVETRKSLGRVSNEKGEYSKALDEYEKVLDLEESRQNSSGQIYANKAIGEVYEKQNRNEEALEFYTKSEAIARETDDEKNVISASKNIKEVYRKEGRVEDELTIRKRSLSGFLADNNDSAASEEYNQIASLYLKKDNPDMALNFLGDALILSKKAGNLQKETETYLALSKAYRQKAQYKNALSYYEQYVIHSDSLKKQTENRLASKIELSQELSLRQKKIEFLEKDLALNNQAMALLQNEKQLQRLVIYSLGAVLLVFGFASVAIYRISRKRRRANLLLALKSLRTQMNPHFIFNALNSVNSFIAQSNERAANKYLSDFSRLMREVMENSQHDFIPLSTEIKILELYMALEHARFTDKFEYSLEVDPSLDRDSVFLPPMLVQPYVENAVWHGLRYLEGKGQLKVSFKKAEDTLQIVVQDNGIGRKKSAEIKTINQKTRISTGLKNTENRIGLINEIHHTGLKVEVTDLDSVSGTGTEVHIEIPLSNLE